MVCVMSDKEWIIGIVTNSSLKSFGFNRCSKCKRIFEISEKVHTKADELNYQLCDKCFEEVINNE